MYLLLLGALFEHELQAPFEQVNRHLPVMEREEQEVPLWETTEQFAVAEGEMSEQKAAWTAGEGGGGGVGVGAGEGGGRCSRGRRRWLRRRRRRGGLGRLRRRRLFCLGLGA